MPPLRNKLRGFTLLELLVVIAIIGVLAAVVLASLSDSRAAARNTAFTSELRQLIIALERFNLEQDTYPLHNGPWDCLGDGADRGGFCGTHSGFRFYYADNGPDTATLLPDYYDHTRMRVYAASAATDGIVYRAHDGGRGYEIIYFLEGAVPDTEPSNCLIGFGRDRQVGAQDISSCTVCGGSYDSTSTTTDWCSDYPFIP